MGATAATTSETAIGSTRGTKQTTLEQFCAQREGANLRMLREAQLIDLSSEDGEGQRRTQWHTSRGAPMDIA